MKRLLPKLPKHIRAERGLGGYRGMIAVVALIGLVAILATTGTLQRGLCVIDSDTCKTVPSGDATPSFFDTGALPAASDERAVFLGAGLDSVPPGSHNSVAGRTAAVPAGSSQSLTQLWSTSADTAQSGFSDDSMLIALDDLPCGTSTSGPCDVWEGLQSDSTADRTQGAERLSLLGLDPFVGIESETRTLDLTLSNSFLAQDESSDAPIFYRHSQRLRDGATSESWAWQQSTDTVARVSVERSRGGLLHSVTIIGASSESDDQVKWTTISIPVTDSSREALDQWVSTFTVDGPSLPDELWESTASVDADDEILLRLVHTTGQVTRETLSAGGEFSGVTPQLLRDDPEHTDADLTVTATERLGDLDALGRREFVSKEER
ncbi:Hypothetical protein AAM4_0482 [Actinomyces succiniciruminis]|uniref:Uncharacterized protein n=2 Tax=Actinomyces succiniciruminis TaxID=1522002 RepID=A0A1L7R989_9ACTO|nr:Hypothetical protein AAM4_0482 [Actinomyces succiniciruminis]